MPFAKRHHNASASVSAPPLRPHLDHPAPPEGPALGPQFGSTSMAGGGPLAEGFQQRKFESAVRNCYTYLFNNNDSGSAVHRGLPRTGVRPAPHWCIWYRVDYGDSIEK